jgi:hypothetical protein
MIDRKTNAPRRYFVDGDGHRVLIGLSLEETAEFENLEEASAFGSGTAAAHLRVNIEPAQNQEKRWLELYAKHELAWKAWIAQSRAEHAVNLGFINHG